MFTIWLFQELKIINNNPTQFINNQQNGKDFISSEPASGLKQENLTVVVDGRRTKRCQYCNKNTLLRLAPIHVNGTVCSSSSSLATTG